MTRSLDSATRVAASSRAADGTGLDVRVARGIVADLFQRDRRRYWVEFALSITLAYAAFAAVDVHNPLGPRSIPAFLVSVGALYRAVVFIHEIAHFRTREFKSFRLGWNLLCGIPVLVPYFMYGNHWDHHARPTFGTAGDSEYLPDPLRPGRSALLLLLATFVVPAALALRFAVVFPLSLLVPGLRDLAERRWSALAIQAGYERQRPTPAERKGWLVQEAACAAWLGGLAALVATGVVDPRRVALGYAVIVGVQLVNTLRLLVAHRYHRNGTPSTIAEQVADSLDYPSGFAPELWAPVGLRYHAIHHLFPSMPYHCLAQAHRRLAAAGPEVVDLSGSMGRGMFAQLRELLAGPGGRPALNHDGGRTA